MKALLLTALLLSCAHPISPPAHDVARVASAIIKQAHRYHGILVSELRDGQWVFEREGKVCRLFTEGFLMSRKKQ